MGSDLDGAVQFFRDLRARKQPLPLARQSTVRASGALLGAAVVFAYILISLISQGHNVPAASSGQPPFGWLGNRVAGVAVGALVGLLCAWPRSAATGIATSSAGIALALGAVPSLALGALGGLATEVTVLLCAPLGFVFFFLVSTFPMLLLRWAATVQGELADRPWWIWQRLRLPLLLLALAGVMAIKGAFSGGDHVPVWTRHRYIPGCTRYRTAYHCPRTDCGYLCSEPSPNARAQPGTWCPLSDGTGSGLARRGLCCHAHAPARAGG